MCVCVYVRTPLGPYTFRVGAACWQEYVVLINTGWDHFPLCGKIQQEWAPLEDKRDLFFYQLARPEASDHLPLSLSSAASFSFIGSLLHKQMRPLLAYVSAYRTHIAICVGRKYSSQGCLMQILDAALCHFRCAMCGGDLCSTFCYKWQKDALCFYRFLLKASNVHYKPTTDDYFVDRFAFANTKSVFFLSLDFSDS